MKPDYRCIDNINEIDNYILFLPPSYRADKTWSRVISYGLTPKQDDLSQVACPLKRPSTKVKTNRPNDSIYVNMVIQAAATNPVLLCNTPIK